MAFPPLFLPICRREHGMVLEFDMMLFKKPCNRFLGADICFGIVADADLNLSVSLIRAESLAMLTGLASHRSICVTTSSLLLIAVQSNRSMY